MRRQMLIFQNIKMSIESQVSLLYIIIIIIIIIIIPFWLLYDRTRQYTRWPTLHLHVNHVILLFQPMEFL